jgi:hypothetical protein
VIAFAASAAALAAFDVLLTFRAEPRERRILLILSVGAGLLLGLVSLVERDAAGIAHEARPFHLYVAVASFLWCAGAAIFLLPHCLDLFPARLFCAPRAVAALASLIGVLFRGFAAGDWQYFHTNWFFIAHLAASALAFAFGLLMLVLFLLFGKRMAGGGPPQA